jgi:hypothetical protein
MAPTQLKNSGAQTDMVKIAQGAIPVIFLIERPDQPQGLNERRLVPRAR